MNTPPGVDFSMLLASSVHDIKNSLGMLISSLDEVVKLESCTSPDQRKSFGILHSEASRINHSLIHLLGLYRLQNEQLKLQSNEVYVLDFLEEQVTSLETLFEASNINVTIDCDDSIVGFFDQSLIASVISNILVNCEKYTKDNLLLSVNRSGKGLAIQIQDNGQGYPQTIIDHLSNELRGLDFETGSTNLGLFFASEIAHLHYCDNKHGSISLHNNDTGGCFTLNIP